MGFEIMAQLIRFQQMTELYLIVTSDECLLFNEYSGMEEVPVVHLVPVSLSGNFQTIILK